MTIEERPEFLLVREYAASRRISLRTAYKLVAEGAVPAVKVGGQWRIARAELDRQLADATKPAA